MSLHIHIHRIHSRKQGWHKATCVDRRACDGHPSQPDAVLNQQANESLAESRTTSPFRIGLIPQSLLVSIVKVENKRRSCALRQLFFRPFWGLPSGNVACKSIVVSVTKIDKLGLFFMGRREIPAPNAVCMVKRLVVQRYFLKGRVCSRCRCACSPCCWSHANTLVSLE
jgi:hypothetical protein